MKLIILLVLFCSLSKAQKPIKVIMLCIDTSLIIKKIPYPIGMHTLAGTGIEADYSKKTIEERSYDTRCFWQYGFKINNDYFDLYKERLPKKLIVLIYHILN